jgi:hypothetical protein
MWMTSPAEALSVGVARYCFVCRVTVARPRALRVSQPIPWRARTGSVESRGVLVDEGGEQEGRGFMSAAWGAHVEG